MAQIPRVIENIDSLRTDRRGVLLDIFRPISAYKQKLDVFQDSLGGSLFFGISDGKEYGANFREWRFQTVVDSLRGNYHEVWLPLGKGKYFLERSYFHLYFFDQSEFKEIEYILLHCDACEPNDTPHAIYKQSPHIHVEVAEQPIPKAHFALYNGRVDEVLKCIESFNIALKESVQMIDSQILKAL